MSWPMPTGQWNPGNTGTPPTMAPGQNMGNYNQDQWAMQHQSWQQWAQWQQQYAQWQSQYGDKYAMQMQAMGAVPPLPANNAAPPPAPPPPDQPPPPPPPHENNQPLYGSAPTPAPPPKTQQQTNTSGNNTCNSTSTGNHQTWQYPSETSSAQPPQGVNSEALKKLAEEEKLFDIQFQKWEEEIQKWRRENVNHPDKTAYKEYESKFEACRAQLLERRQQMDQKKARLLSNSQQQSQTATKPAPVPPPNVPTNSTNFNQSRQSLNYNNNSVQNDYSNQPDYQQYSQSGYKNRNNKSIDPQDRYESYAPVDVEPVVKTSFLPATNSGKGIPGLDLVPESEKMQNSHAQHAIIEITEDQDEPLPVQGVPPPDYSKISKGINNILGDEKIMNILNMVRGSIPDIKGNVQHSNQQQAGSQQLYQGQHYQGQQHQGQQHQGQQHQGQQHQGQQHQGPPPQQHNNYSNNKYDNFNTNQYDKPPPNLGNRNHNNQQYGNRQNFNERPDSNFQNQPNQDQNSYNEGQNQYNQNQFNQQKQRNNFQQGPNINQDDYSDRNAEYGDQNNMGNTRPGPPIRQNLPPRPLMEIRDPLSEIPNDYHRGPQGIMHVMNEPPPLLPPKPKWVDEPMFTPTFIVEYEHKPLRSKVRDFIEPVHTFDYNHISKDEENKKKNFEKEADEMFVRLPRRELREYEESRYPDRYVRDTYARDSHSRDTYERRVPREEHIARVPPPIRDDYDDRRRDERYDERRREDRDRFRPRDDYYKDRNRMDSDRGRMDMERGRMDMERGRTDMDRGRIDMDRGRTDMDRGRNDGDRGRMEMERGRVEMDRGRPEGDRDPYRPRDKENRREDSRRRSRSRERESRNVDSRKRAPSKESEVSDKSKRPKESNSDGNDKAHVVMIDDILENPGREMRPEKIVVILRGIPGSGKSYLAKLIRDREAEYGGTARIMSIDDYFMQEGEIEEQDPTGKIIKKATLKYEYDEKSEETYINSLKRAFKRTITDGFFSFLIFDAVNDQLKSYADVWNFARQNGFQVYICTMEMDVKACFKRNIHNRSLQDLEIVAARFFPTPKHHIELDPTTLLQSAAITDVQMEDATDDVVMEDVQDTEVESAFTSKWEKLDDVTQLARLDGTSKPLRPSQLSMEDYLQLDDWQPNKAKPGKKTVRWADIEERREQEKMRAIGFVVGQTNWDRMTDPTMGSSALTQTKYIERVNKRM